MQDERVKTTNGSRALEYIVQYIFSNSWMQHWSIVVFIEVWTDLILSKTAKIHNPGLTCSYSVFMFLRKRSDSQFLYVCFSYRKALRRQSFTASWPQPRGSWRLSLGLSKGRFHGMIDSCLFTLKKLKFIFRYYSQLPKSWRNPKNLEISLGEGFCGSRGDAAFSLCLG